MENKLDLVKLIQPDNAPTQVKQIYDEICRVKDPRWLGPLFGFFAISPLLLKAWWELQKQLELLEGDVPRILMNKIAMICAIAVDCPRCISFHKSDLIDRLQLNNDEINKLQDFENSDLPESEKVVYRVAKKITLNEQMTDKEFNDLRAVGYADAAIVEIVSVSMMESGFARHASVFARFENGIDWPAHHTPSPEYKSTLNQK